MAVTMKCHYEVLGIARDAVDDDIKKAYRKLALKWHPDKNLDNPEQAKEQFQLVQQAWEILSDSHERAWYDKHREAILRGCRGENYKDNAVDLFQYFSNACYKGYGDNDKGFYTVYRNVFEKLAAEDAEFAEDESDYQVPGFGDSQSPYEDVVHEFYAYWQSYSTKRSYVWLDPYDLRDKLNRRVLRAVEKENRKVREKARRERNEQVRNLVAFVRKRDKRVQAYAAKLAERNREKLRKMEERKRAQLLERQKHLREHTESEWSKFSNIEEELKKIEVSRAVEFGEELLSDDNGSNDDSFVYGDTFYCVACNKIFKTCKAFTNHENSRKHKENVNALKASMVKSDEDSNSDISSRESNSTAESTSFSEPQLATNLQMPDFLLNSSSDKNNDNDNSEEFVSPDELISDDEEKRECSRPTSERKRLNGGNIAPILVVGPQMDTDSSVSVKVENTDGDVTSEDELISDEEEDITPSHQKKKKIKRKRNVQNPYPVLSRVSDDDTESINEDSLLSKKQRKKLQQRKTAVMNKPERNHKEKQMIECENEITAARLSDGDKDVTNAVNQKFLRVNKAKKSRRERKEEKSKKESIVNIDDLAHCCISCSSKFSSKNKLFEHLKKTGHSVPVPAGTQKSKKSGQICSKKQF